MIGKKYTDMNMMYPRREKNEKIIDDRIACIIPRKGDKSLSSHDLPSRNTLAKKLAAYQKI